MLNNKNIRELREIKVDGSCSILVKHHDLDVFDFLYKENFSDLDKLLHPNKMLSFELNFDINDISLVNFKKIPGFEKINSYSFQKTLSGYVIELFNEKNKKDKVLHIIRLGTGDLIAQDNALNKTMLHKVKVNPNNYIITTLYKESLCVVNCYSINNIFIGNWNIQTKNIDIDLLFRMDENLTILTQLTQ